MIYAMGTEKGAKNPLVLASVLTIIFGIGSIFLSYILTPFAAAFYAALLLAERKRKKILSLIIPIAIWLLAFAFYGPFAMEGIIYVAIGCIIYAMYTRNASKAQCAFFATTVTVISILLSTLFLAFVVTKQYSIESALDFYRKQFEIFKQWFAEFLTSVSLTSGNGGENILFSEYDAEEILNSAVVSLIPTLFVISFAISGIALKVFSIFVKFYSASKSPVYSWDFNVANIVAYTFIAVAILNMFTTSSGIFSNVISSIYLVLFAIFFYIGLRFAVFLLSKKIGTVPAVIVSVFILILSLILFMVFIYTVLAFLGVYFTVITNKLANISSDEN